METVDSCILCGYQGIKVIDRKASVCKCRNCGHVFNNPRPSRKEIERYYSQASRYDHWLPEEKSRERMWGKRLKMLKKERQSGSLLDVGAGTGHFLRLARESFEVTGNEISTEALRLARERNDIELIHGDLMDIELGKGFDVITIFHILEHVHDPAALIGRCNWLLADDGILIVAVPNDVHSLKSYLTRLLALLRVGKWRDYGLSGFPDILNECAVNEIHLSHFTTSTLKSFLSDSGFRVKHTTLDPANAGSGLKFMVNEVLYYCCLCLYKLTRVNLYDTIWMTCTRI